MFEERAGLLGDIRDDVDLVLLRRQGLIAKEDHEIFSQRPVHFVVLAIAIAVSCCLPVSMMERSHITFRLLSSTSPTLGRVLDVVADVAVAVVLALMAWQFWVYAGELVLTGERTYVLKIPAAPFWYASDFIFWIATAVQCVVVVLDVAHLFGASPAPRRAEH